MKDPPHQILDISGHFNEMSRQVKAEPSPRILPPVRAVVDPNVEKIRVKSVDEPPGDKGDKNNRRNNISSLTINEDISSAALDMSGIKEEDSSLKTSPLESISSSNELPLSNPRRLTEIQE